MFNNYVVPDLTGKTAIITGGNSGIGLHAATKLAAKGAHVIIAARNAKRAERSIKEIKKRYDNASCEFIQLDLTSFKSIQKFIGIIKLNHPVIDILINNAGVIMQDPRNISKEGFDPHIATNCLGHFLLTVGLLDCLKKAPKARIVTVASMAEKLGLLDVDNFAEKNVPGWLSYTYSKVATLVNSYELNRKLQEAGLTHIKSVASHPGLTNTESPQIKGLNKVIVNGIGMPIEKGALSLLVAATNDELEGGEYVGYDGFLGLNGNICLTNSSKKTCDPTIAKRLWEKCETLTNISFDEEIKD
jgi:NAD(P)-dependent dehydrogenase (short-subunit alcohol dehydrogenase family)